MPCGVWMFHKMRWPENNTKIIKHGRIFTRGNTVVLDGFGRFRRPPNSQIHETPVRNPWVIPKTMILNYDYRINIHSTSIEFFNGGSPLLLIATFGRFPCLSTDPNLTPG